MRPVALGWKKWLHVGSTRRPAPRLRRSSRSWSLAAGLAISSESISGGGAAWHEPEETFRTRSTHPGSLDEIARGEAMEGQNSYGCSSLIRCSAQPNRAQAHNPAPLSRQRALGGAARPRSPQRLTPVAGISDCGLQQPSPSKLDSHEGGADGRSRNVGKNISGPDEAPRLPANISGGSILFIESNPPTDFPTWVGRTLALVWRPHAKAFSDWHAARGPLGL